MNCSICQLPYEGHGKDAHPINSGRCCDNCFHLAISARLNVILTRAAQERKDNTR